ncbi:MAG: tetratricopeptide repeat protein [Ferruginibacter sp.]
MKKNILYLLLIIFFVGAVSFVVVKYKHKKESESKIEYFLLPRAGNNSKEEWAFAKKYTDSLITRIAAKPGDSKSKIALVNAYIIESRISGNMAYYDRAAMKTVESILAKEPEHADALMLKSLVQLSQHHFAEGLTTATTVVNLKPNNAFGYGLLVDANIEMGNYKAALEAAEKMISIRPDMRSYSRISYLREIHGDYPGAISAMKLAVAAGVPAEEPTEWSRTQLGRLYEQLGRVSEARYQYQLSLAARPDYSNALAGLGRLAAHEKKYDSTVYYFQQASGFTNDLDVRQNLATALQNAGQSQKAIELRKDIINDMNKNVNNADDPELGHYSDKELAIVYLENNNTDKALQHAMAEYNRRPQNIEVNETMALVYYKRNEAAKALPYLKTALSTNSKKPALLTIAALIYLKSGNAETAKQLLSEISYHPVMPQQMLADANEAYKIAQR